MAPRADARWRQHVRFTASGLHDVPDVAEVVAVLVARLGVLGEAVDPLSVVGPLLAAFGRDRGPCARGLVGVGRRGGGPRLRAATRTGARTARRVLVERI